MGENLVAGILKNIETLATVNANQNVSILTGINKTNTILSKEIGKELTKQTKLLQEIAKGLVKGTGGSSSISIFNSSGTKSFGKMFKKRGGKALQKMALGMDKFADATKKFVDAINELDEKKFETFSALFDMGKKILLFSLAILLAGPLLAIGILTTMPFLALWVLFFKWLGTMTKGLKRAAKALMFISASVLAIVLSIAISALLISKLGWKPILMVMGTLIGVAIAFNIISAIDGGAKDGAKSMLFLALTTAIVIVILILSADYLEKVGLSSFLIVIGVLLAVSLVFMLISLVSEKSNKGAISMIFLAIATALVVGIIYFVSEMVGDIEKFKTTAIIIGVVLIGLALVFVIAGLLKSQIMFGALAMFLVAIVVGIIAFSLVKVQQAKVSWETIGILSAFIVGMGVAFGAAGLVAPFIALGGAAMLIVAGAIWVFTDSLAKFTKAEWSTEKTEMLANTIVSLVGAVKAAFDDFGIADFARMFAGVKLLSNLGNALSAFAEGVGAFATLELSEVIQEGEGENAKFTVKKKGSIDPAAISSNISLLLQEVTKPLIDFGAANSDGGGWFSDGFLGTGIKLLGNLGNALGNFALGLSFFGTMETVKFDEKGVVIPGSQKPIDVLAIGTGISAIIGSITKPLIALGENDDMDDGIERLEELASPMFKFAESIAILDKTKMTSSKFVNAFYWPITYAAMALSSKAFKGIDADKAEDVGDIIESMVSSISDLDGKGEGIGKMFIDMKSSINGMDLKKLTKLNSLTENLADFADSMNGNFGDLEAVLEKLKDAIAEMNGIEVGSASATATAAPVTQSETKMDLSPLLAELELVTDTLRAGIDVNIQNTSFS
tara:strand:- start:7846 stop:10374 length:2529 start_codon:yes stop_codon:yes gene_type:complete